jgi:hypothetical protein
MISVERPTYRLDVDGTRAALSSADGRPWAALRLLAALDTTDAPDETLTVSTRVEGDVVLVERHSTIWDRATVELVCGPDELELRTSVTGSGALRDVHLLGGRSLVPGAPTGFLPSGSSFRTLFSPNPSGRLVRAAGESAVIGVVGDGEPGRRHWFFTPAPLFLALTTAEGVEDPADEVADGWLGIALAARVEELDFVQLEYRPGDQAFSLLLEYEGHTRVDGEFAAPTVLLTPGLSDPYAGLRRNRAGLVARGDAPPPTPRETPPWWSEPIFCGWGAQCHLAESAKAPPQDFATQQSYDSFLAHLERQGVVPGIVEIDDKWQEQYGTCIPDRGKWPALGDWIRQRQGRGQHVLLWWKAWDVEGLAPELCIRNPDGAAVALDPTNPAARETLTEIVTRMVAPDGIGADGLKIDFTGRAPAGTALAAHGGGWGIALLHELLELVYSAAKEAKPDALVVTHTPHPSFADVTDMIRLNDMIQTEDPIRRVPSEMRYRAEVARASCPELLIDTDDWRVPDLETWRAYLRVKSEFGVPALYYASHLDATGEPLTPDDYEEIGRAWAAWRETGSTDRA